MTVKLKWITPDAEAQLVEIARVSANPELESRSTDEELLQYFREHNHWSPFEMVSACFEINTTRDIARQILRHRSFSFQEFSQRYQDVGVLEMADTREARLQDKKNRQNSIETDDLDMHAIWDDMQKRIIDEALGAYEAALEMGIAKEVARAVLPEGLTPSKLYMTGTIRSWMHYTSLRTGNGTQKEHMWLAQHIYDALSEEMPSCFPEMFW